VFFGGGGGAWGGGGGEGVATSLVMWQRVLADVPECLFKEFMYYVLLLLLFTCFNSHRAVIFNNMCC